MLYVLLMIMRILRLCVTSLLSPSSSSRRWCCKVLLKEEDEESWGASWSEDWCKQGFQSIIQYLIGQTGRVSIIPCQWPFLFWGHSLKRPVSHWSLNVGSEVFGVIIWSWATCFIATKRLQLVVQKGDNVDFACCNYSVEPCFAYIENVCTVFTWWRP